ncbi:MAG: hypothetical protein IT307_00965 [Chloroflexi bacterium]|nr:hypothetical protein [Chloroflexota bacterium]
MTTAPTARGQTVADPTFQTIRISRASGTHADVFAAVGLADLLRDAANDQRVTIKQVGTAFEVCLSRRRALSDLWLRPRPGYRYLIPKSGQALPPGIAAADAIDYERYRDQIRRLREQEEELRKAAGQKKEPPNQEALEQLRKSWPMPREDWRRFPTLRVLQGHGTANTLAADFAKAGTASREAEIRRGLKALLEDRPSGLSWPVSGVQLFTPLAAKGYARLKPDSTGRNDKTKEAWTDPFLEWLRYRGYFTAAVPAFHGSKGEHIRLLAPIPGDIGLGPYGQLVDRLTPPGGASPPKIDSLVTLRLAGLLIEHSEEFASRSEDRIPGLSLKGRSPGAVISGLTITNFQSLGSARAVSVVSELSIPSWFPIRSAADAESWLGILDEHQAIVRDLRDDHSDEVALLQTYRGFLQRRGEGALAAMVDFAGAYGQFVVRAREAKRRVRQFRGDLLRRVVDSMSNATGKPFTPILDDEGFRAVAAAVRRATVSAQSLKANGQDHREIRYGLLPELRRASELPTDEPLLSAVAEFISLYNAENARRRETRHAAPRNVTTEELRAFTLLLDDYHAAVVGKLLCAFGSCRDPRERDAGTETSDGGDEAASPMDGTESEGTASETPEDE